MYNAVLCSNSCIRICFKLSTSIQQRWSSQVNFYETYELTDCSTATKLQKCKQCDCTTVDSQHCYPLHASYRILAALPLALDCSMKFSLKVYCITGSQGIITFPPQSRTHYYVLYDALEDNIELLPVFKLHTVHRGLSIHWSQQRLAVTCRKQWPTAESKMWVTCLQYSSYPCMHKVNVLWYLWV